MKKMLGCFAFIISTTVCAQEFAWKIDRVIDGDTFAVQVKDMPADLKLSVRVIGIDTPEKGKKAKCDKEALLGKQATEKAKEIFAAAKKVTFSNIKWDKYGGRVDAKVTVDGKDYSQMMIDLGLAKPYFGEKKESWCNE